MGNAATNSDAEIHLQTLCAQATGINSNLFTPETGKVRSFMNLRISGKHMEIGEAFRSRIESRIGGAIDKYFDGGFSGHVTVEKSGSGYSADCMVHLDTGTALQAAGKAHEPQTAFEAAADRIEKRLRRYKRKLKAHPTGAAGPDIEAGVAEIELPDVDDEEADEAEMAPAVVAETRVGLKSLTVAGATVALEAEDHPVLLFRNAATGALNVVYRRKDGNIGWIDPSSAE